MKLSEEQKQFLISYNIEKAETAVNDAQFLIDNQRLNIAYNRIYYACFYIITALSLKSNFSTSKHTQLIGWFNRNYVNENVIDKKFGQILNKAFDQRSESDYGVMLKPSSENALQLLSEVKEFVQVVKKLIIE